MKQSRSDLCLFYKRDSNGFFFMAITVDDLLIATNTTELVTKMKIKFKITDLDLGEPEYIIGIHVDYNMRE